jgi:23S rRNA (adenine1618-N6)-methyltransferase
MPKNKKKHSPEKIQLHPRNKHQDRYDYVNLVLSYPSLSPYLSINDFGEMSVNFADPVAVKMLNASLLSYYYGVTDWTVPDGYLCPPVPGRADYIHYMADLLAVKNGGIIPVGNEIVCLDTGVGASCIYPIIGICEYGWNFIGTDIDQKSLEASQKIITSNAALQNKVDFRLQKFSEFYFKNIINPGELVDLAICNPPFHTSSAAAHQANERKNSNLKITPAAGKILNFGGTSRELWCEGGEGKFVSDMIRESALYATSCFWFSALISKKSNLTGINRALKNALVAESRIITMGQGNKISRLVAWTFLDIEQQKTWANKRWLPVGIE